ncbi:MAG: hypothetical protein IPK99_00290 [Flavobacteriales bacterium]|nr:hypothetical protein [Flavobacteriales bacterium]
MRRGSGMTLVPELSVTPDDTHVRRFAAPEPVSQVSLVVRTPFVRRKLIRGFGHRDPRLLAGGHASFARGHAVGPSLKKKGA